MNPSRSIVCLAVSLALAACGGEVRQTGPASGVDAGGTRPPPGGDPDLPPGGRLEPDPRLEPEPGGGSTAPDAAAPSPRTDCRDDYPQVPWTRVAENECSKCYTCAGDGFLPGAAFVTCRIDGACYRFATVDNCNYELCPPGRCVLPVHDEAAYCRKDGRNYTYFICRVGGQRFEFQTVDGTHYRDTAESPDPIGDIAGNLPIVGGCPDHGG